MRGLERERERSLDREREDESFTLSGVETRRKGTLHLQQLVVYNHATRNAGEGQRTRVGGRISSKREAPKNRNFFFF